MKRPGSCGRMEVWVQGSCGGERCGGEGVVEGIEV